MSLYKGIELPNRPDPENIRKLDLLPLPQIARMMRVGVAIDPPRLHQLTSDFTTKATALRKDITNLIPPDKLDLFVSDSDSGLPDLNPQSSIQTAELLFEVLGIGKGRNLKRTSTGLVSTGKKQLEAIKLDHPVVQLILDYRGLLKLVSTYTSALPSLAKIHPKGPDCPICSRHHYSSHPRVHTQILTTRTDTGRLASKGPNLNNIPARTDEGRLVREGFVASEGMRLVDVDYAQIELRGVADQSGDENMIRIFKADGDIHTDTAMRAFGLENEKQVDKLLHRAPCKNVNFGVCVAEGQLVLTNRGLVPIETVSCYDMVWDGIEYVEHDGVVCKGNREVITYQGLTATEEHEVWLETGGAVSLGRAKTEGLDLAVTAIGAVAVRYSPCGAGDERGEEGERVQVCVPGVPGLQANEMGAGGQRPWGQEQPVQMQTSEVHRPEVTAITGEVGGDVPEMQQPIKPELQELWREGNRMPVQVPRGVHLLGTKKSSSSDVQEDRYRPDRQRWALRAGESEADGSKDESKQYQKESQSQLRRGVCDSNGVVVSAEERLRGFQVEFGEDSSSGHSGSSMGRDYLEGTEEKKTAVVYDIMNAGPRRRFTVSGNLVSNCYGLGPLGLYDLMAVTYATAKKPLPGWVTVDWCQSFINQWFSLYPACRDYFQSQHLRALRWGIVWTPAGRVRRIPEVYSAHSRVREAGLRQAGNMPIQGFAADIFKLGLARVEGGFGRLREFGVDVEALLPIHDEVLVEVEEDWAEEVLDVTKGEMALALVDEQTGVLQCRVPITTDGKISERWSKD